MILRICKDPTYKIPNIQVYKDEDPPYKMSQNQVYNDEDPTRKISPKQGSTQQNAEEPAIHLKNPPEPMSHLIKFLRPNCYRNQ